MKNAFEMASFIWSMVRALFFSKMVGIDLLFLCLNGDSSFPFENSESTLSYLMIFKYYSHQHLKFLHILTKSPSLLDSSVSRDNGTVFVC